MLFYLQTWVNIELAEDTNYLTPGLKMVRSDTCSDLGEWIFILPPTLRCKIAKEHPQVDCL